VLGCGVVGTGVGRGVGRGVGTEVGSGVAGEGVGTFVGDGVGSGVGGAGVGTGVGEGVGCGVGVGVGATATTLVDPSNVVVASTDTVSPSSDCKFVAKVDDVELALDIEAETVAAVVPLGSSWSSISYPTKM